MPSPSQAPKHLNNTGCYIKLVQGKGRAVFASHVIPAGTLVEISPILLFSKEEYHEHGRHTVLDHFTFKWPDGRMALALGLGSLFNHSDRPNVSFSLDTSTDSIRYITSRTVQKDEELCIFYGYKLWFEVIDFEQGMIIIDPATVEEDGWGGLLNVAEESGNPWVEGDPDQVISEEDLPFIRTKLTDYEDEDDESSIRTMEVWVVDIPDSRHTSSLLKWLKRSGLDIPDLSHLKRIRKRDGLATFLIAPASAPLPSFPEDIDLPEAYKIQVPKSSALTNISFKLKSNIWPTSFTPPRKHELDGWTRGKVAWAWEAMQKIIEYAKSQNELPIAAYIPLPYGSEPSLSQPFIAHDTRRSAGHPLRHACQNLIRLIADHLATLSDANTNYLLTSLTLFVTHEPCIMCSMALLHSRVKQVIYLIPMPKTGGCGSGSGHVCLSKLHGVNHRFAISQWKIEGNLSGGDVEELRIEDGLDA